jgi:hypothetical protein
MFVAELDHLGNIYYSLKIRQFLCRRGFSGIIE